MPLEIMRGHVALSGTGVMGSGGARTWGGTGQIPPEGMRRVGDLLVTEVAGTGLSVPSKSVAHTLLIGYEGGDRP